MHAFDPVSGKIVHGLIGIELIEYHHGPFLVFASGVYGNAVVDIGVYPFGPALRVISQRNVPVRVRRVSFGGVASGGSQVPGHARGSALQEAVLPLILGRQGIF